MIPLKERIKNEDLEVFIDRGDISSTIKLVKDYKTQEDFVDHILEAYDESAMMVIDNFRSTLIEEGYPEDEIIEAFENIEEGPYVNYDKFLDQRVRVDIMFAFYDDANYDMPSNRYGWLRWLLKQQGGYSYKKLKPILTGEANHTKLDNKFLLSVQDEILNNTHVMTAFTTLGNMTVREYYTLKEQQKSVKTITIPPEATVGLFNPWVGGGSILGIELQLPMTVNPKNIFGIAVEDENPYGYSANQVYGLVHSVWDNPITVNEKKRR